jgi:hypothetical protein
MALKQIFKVDLRNPYQKFNQSQKRYAKQINLFGDPSFVTAESIEESLRNDLQYTLNEDPEQAQTIVENAINGKQNKPDHQQALRRAGLTDFDLSTFQTEERLIQQERQQLAFVGATAGTFAFRSALRVAGNAAANQAVTSGKVVQFENQQRNFNNLKRVVGFGGTLAGLGFAVASGATTLGVGAALALASQAINLYVENDKISAKQTRQDLNAQYYQEAFGGIVRRGNR